MPAPRDALPQLVGALRDVFGRDLRCALLKGSVLHGDEIPYWSDLDVHAFVDGADRGAPDWPRAVAFQRAIGRHDPEAYGVSQFQVSFVPGGGYPKEWPVPYPASYEVLFGEVPASFASPSVEEHLDRASTDLARTAADRDSLVRSFVDKPDRSVARYVRLLGTYLAGKTFSAAVLLSGDPERVHASRRAALIHVVGEALGNERELVIFDALAREWREVREKPEQARAMFAAGMSALDAFAAADVG
ncbi:MAG TPA: hypothetical protein VFM93_08120 [Candidatus Limnocylindria bacterium]|nr:hypothetical protein [Candidatus Limnocylindria bacterium]